MTSLLRAFTIVLTGLCALDVLAQTGEHEVAASAYRRGHYLESYYIWKRLAADGHPPSAYNLAVLYARGQGVSRDPGKAAELYLESADADYAPAQFNLGMAYLLGDGVERDYQKAANWWVRAAEQGHIQAMFNLANLFDTGLGVSKDQEVARKLYKRAADLGDARAAQKIAEAGGSRGAREEGGKGTGSDPVKGKDWVMRQPDQNYAIQILADNSASTVQSFLDNHRLRNSSVVIRVSREGVTWYKVLYGSFDTRQEAQLVRDEMRRYLADESPWLRNFRDIKREIEGKLLLAGRQMLEDRTHALDSLADGTDFGAALRRGQYAFNRQQYDEALEAWLPLARSDVAEAQYGIGFMYESGWGVEKDHGQAFQWYERAAHLGHAKSQYNLGRLYLSGRGVERDEQKGLDWIEQAAAQNDRRAMEYLADAAAEKR